MSCTTDTLFIHCPIAPCSHEVSIKVPHDKVPSPSQAVRLHERMLGHLRSEHVSKRPKRDARSQP